MNPLAEITIRAGKSLAIHLIFAALLYGLALLLMSSFDNASVSIRDQYEANDVLILLAAKRNSVVAWFMAALGFSWLASTVFLAIAQGRKKIVSSDTQARRAMPWWIVLFILALVVSIVLWWRQVSLGGVAQVLVDGNYLFLVTSGHVAVGLAFWLATGLAVTITLKPAVPLADSILPRFWN